MASPVGNYQIMESSTSSLESLQSHGLHLRNVGRETPQANAQDNVRLNRPDLQDEDFQKLDLHKVDEFKKALRPNFVFGGHGDKLKISEPVALVSFDKVELVGEYFAGGHVSYIYRARVNGQWFACKKAWILTPGDRESYEKEKECLKTLRNPGNWHIVQLMAYHTADACNEGRLILSPLAECTLQHYLSRNPTPGCKQTVTRWFGCLAGALSDIHRRKIKHKDIKTTNILVHGDNIVIADLGISTKFADQSSSDGVSPGSSMYMAPEALSSEHRGRRQDVWSLLCCFIEMVSFISGFTITQFREWCKPPQQDFSFSKDYETVLDWLNHLKSQTKSEAHFALLDLLLNWFKKLPEERPTAKTLFRQLRSMGTFVGECCACLHGSDAGSISVSSLSGVLPSANPEPVQDFIVSTRDCMANQLGSQSVPVCMEELLQRVVSGQVRSLRSSEKNLLFYIAPRRCDSANEYLSLCKAFIDQLIKAVSEAAYDTYLYDPENGENEWPYSTAYFAVLFDIVLSRYRVDKWNYTESKLNGQDGNRDLDLETDSQQSCSCVSSALVPSSGRT